MPNNYHDTTIKAPYFAVCPGCLQSVDRHSAVSINAYPGYSSNKVLCDGRIVFPVVREINVSTRAGLESAVRDYLSLTGCRLVSIDDKTGMVNINLDASASTAICTALYKWIVSLAPMHIVYCVSREYKREEPSYSASGSFGISAKDMNAILGAFAVPFNPLSWPYMYIWPRGLDVEAGRAKVNNACHSGKPCECCLKSPCISPWYCSAEIGVAVQKRQARQAAKRLEDRRKAERTINQSPLPKDYELRTVCQDNQRLRQEAAENAVALGALRRMVDEYQEVVDGEKRRQAIAVNETLAAQKKADKKADAYCDVCSTGVCYCVYSPAMAAKLKEHYRREVAETKRDLWQCPACHYINDGSNGRGALRGYCESVECMQAVGRHGITMRDATNAQRAERRRIIARDSGYEVRYVPADSRCLCGIKYVDHCPQVGMPGSYISCCGIRVKKQC